MKPEVWPQEDEAARAGGGGATAPNADLCTE